MCSAWDPLMDIKQTSQCYNNHFNVKLEGMFLYQNE